MGFFNTLLDVAVGVPIRAVVAPLKVAKNTIDYMTGEIDAEEVLADNVRYVLNGTSDEEAWDGHNLTGRGRDD